MHGKHGCILAADIIIKVMLQNLFCYFLDDECLHTHVAHGTVCEDSRISKPHIEVIF